MGIVIVGAGLAGARTAEECRRRGYGGSITIVGAEPHLPYDRPPLSKQVLRGEVSDTTLYPLDHYTAQRIELRLGVVATALDPAGKSVRLADGSSVGYDSLVIATGLTPRRPAGLADLEGVHVLRSIDDCRAIRADLVQARRVLIVGGGFIGCELAASIRQLGREVVLVEPMPSLLGVALGPEVGGLVGRLHTAAGVDVRTGVGLASIHGDSHLRRAVLSDGTELAVDLVVLGIGSTPNTAWAQDSGILLDHGGIVADATGRTSLAQVYAVGDAAAWETPSEHRRLEHWSNVGDQVKVMVPAMLGLAHTETPMAVPYFWSDQYDLKLQALGAPSTGAVVHVVEDDGRRFLAYYERDARLVAVVGAGMPGKVMKSRSNVAAGVPIRDLLPA